MDREILFRGKRTDNSEWIEGVTYITDPDLHTVYIGGYDYYTNEEGLQRDEYCYEVIPSTVGQYTGLRDQNGRRIFEGDIVQIENPKPFKPYVSDIKYVGTSFVWGVYVLGEFNEIEKIEVIGNIHDNPELIGGDSNDSLRIQKAA